MQLFIPDTTQLSYKAPAKLNLFLELSGLRPDGYHEITTFAVPIDFCDTLEFRYEPGNELRWHIKKADYFSETEIIPDGEENSVARAVRFLQRLTGITFGGELTLHKRIPSQAGLGGGTSDAAATLQMFNSGWNLGIPLAELTEKSVELGSDVPLFIPSQPVVCRGRGEFVEPVFHVPTLHFVVFVPKVRLSTGKVFQRHDELMSRHSNFEPVDIQPILDAATSKLHGGDPQRLAPLLFNRMEAAAVSLCPELENVRNAFADLGALAVRMSGSGTTFYALFRNENEARNAAEQLKTKTTGLVFAAAYRSC